MKVGNEMYELTEFEYMKLRDEFAARAMQSLISLDRLRMDDVAEDAYKFADAMMNERLK